VYDFAIIAGIVEPEAFVVRLVEEAARGCQAQSDFTGAMTLHNLAQVIAVLHYNEPSA